MKTFNWKLAFLIAVGFDLLLLGVVVGRGMWKPYSERRRDRHEMRSEWRADQHPRRLLDDAERQQLRPSRRALRRARREVRKALSEEPLDTQRLQKALGELRSATEQAQAGVHQLIVDKAPSLSQKQRRRLMRLAGDGNRRRRKHRKRRRTKRWQKRGNDPDNSPESGPAAEPAPQQPTESKD